MAESDGTGMPEQQAAGQEGAHMAVQHIFLKDASYEAPGVLDMPGSEGQPDMNLSLSQSTNQLDENRWEVVLSLTVTAKQGEKTAFLCEVQQGGVFQFKGFEDKHMPYAINVLCPNVLFPYARAQIHGLISAGGFFAPPLQPINFEAIFAQRLRESQQGGEGAGEAPQG